MFDEPRRLNMARVAVQHTRPQRESPTPCAILPRAQSADALRYLSAAWQERDGYFPCEVSASRQFTVAASVSPERFTSLQIALLLDPAPRAGNGYASALASKIAQRCATNLRSDEVVHFFHDASRLPADADCTALAYLLALRAGFDLEAQAHRALDRIAANLGPGGVVATYFDRTGERAGIIDAVVAANVVRLSLIHI